MGLRSARSLGTSFVANTPRDLLSGRSFYSTLNQPTFNEPFNRGSQRRRYRDRACTGAAATVILNSADGSSSHRYPRAAVRAVEIALDDIAKADRTFPRADRAGSLLGFVFLCLIMARRAAPLRQTGIIAVDRPGETKLSTLRARQRAHRAPSSHRFGRRPVLEDLQVPSSTIFKIIWFSGARSWH
jgi:hypothetical protein